MSGGEDVQDVQDLPQWAGGARFTVHHDDTDVVRLHRDGAPAAVLADAGRGQRLEHWRVSPDGRHVVVLRAAGPREDRETVVLDAGGAPGGTGRTVAAVPCPAGPAPAWSPSGRELLVAHDGLRVRRFDDPGPGTALPGTAAVGRVRALHPASTGWLAHAGAADADGLWWVGPRGPAVLVAAGSLPAAGTTADGRWWVAVDHPQEGHLVLLADPPDPGERPRWSAPVGGGVLDGPVTAVSVAADVLVATRRHGASRLWRFPAAGAPRRVRTPAAGVVLGCAADPAGRHHVRWTDLLRRPANHVLAGDDLPLPAAPADRAGELRRVRVGDGQLVPVFVLRPRGGAPGPLLLTAYGGFGFCSSPVHSEAAQRWVAAGGTWALAAVRGGGEEGPGWHAAGRGPRKQRSVDDVVDVARALEADGTAAPGRTALVGGSHGGLLVAAAAAQHPGAFAAVSASSPVADLLRFRDGGLGARWTAEFGDPDDPRARAGLRRLSPCHALAPAPAHPAVLVGVDDDDARVPSWHGRRLAERWRAVLPPGAADGPPDPQRRHGPVRLRTTTGHGHVVGSRAAAHRQAEEEFAFLSAATGLGNPGPG